MSKNVQPPALYTQPALCTLLLPQDAYLGKFSICEIEIIDPYPIVRYITGGKYYTVLRWEEDGKWTLLNANGNGLQLINNFDTINCLEEELVKHFGS